MPYKYKKWRYRNTFLLTVSIILLIIFADHAVTRGVMASIMDLGFMGLILTGIFIVSTFTTVPATLLLSEMSNVYGFWETVVLATLGAIIGDFIIFRFIRDKIGEEMKDLFNMIAREEHLYTLFHSPLFGWLTPVIGAVVIASPLPDELGLSILGVSNMSSRKFLLMVTALNFIGIFLLVSLFKTLQA